LIFPSRDAVAFWISQLFDYWALTKPEINILIAITTAAAFCIASPAGLSHFPWVCKAN